MPQARREALVAALIDAVRESSTMAVFFHTAIAEQVGLGATDEKTLLILSGGPLTAGEIAQHTGLTTASVTSLIDRLERKGFVRRVRDTKDRRRIIVEPNEEGLAEFARLFDTVQEAFADLLEPYSDEQLATINDFLRRSAQHSRAAIAQLNRRAEAGDDDGANAGTPT